MSRWSGLGGAYARPGWPEDGNPTHTSHEQHDVEERVRDLLCDWEDSGQDFEAKIKLNRDESYFYLVQGLEQLGAGYTSLDASRPWLVYWILHSLELLGCLHQLPRDTAGRCVDFLRLCQHPDGGFGGGPGQSPHLAPTYAGCLALAILAPMEPRALQLVDRPKLYNFFMRCKDKSGGFRVSADGEVDTRGAYTCLAVASLLNIMTSELTDGTAAWLKQCQTYEGGMGGEPGNEAHGGYTFCGLAALVILQQARVLDLEHMLKWAVKRQMPLEGGFQGRTNKLVDGCYSFWVGGLFPLLDFLLVQPGDQAAARPWLFEQRELQKYLLVCCQSNSGGLKDKPGKHSDYYHTCYGLSGLSTAQHTLVEGSSVVGQASNSLKRTNPIYNVESAACEAALAYFAGLPNAGAEVEKATPAVAPGLSSY